MKWFKHQSTARNDERIARLEDKCGLEGYGFYFKMLEIVAEVIDSTDRCAVTYSISRWGRQTNISTKKFLFLAQCCSDVGLMLAQRSGDDMLVKIPNLLKFRDNHTKNLQAASKQDTEEDTYKKDIEKNRDKKNGGSTELPPPEEKKRAAKKEYSDEFNNAFSIYPKRQGDNPKEKAFSAWKARLRDGSTADEMISGVMRYLAYCQAEGNIGIQYVKQAATFFGPDKAFLEPWEVTQKSSKSSSSRSSSFGRQPIQRPDYGEYEPLDENFNNMPVITGERVG
ncbi:MAG: hypothetical protein ACXWT1_20910 [Methylobacter sp.]